MPGENLIKGLSRNVAGTDIPRAYQRPMLHQQAEGDDGHASRADCDPRSRAQPHVPILEGSVFVGLVGTFFLP